MSKFLSAMLLFSLTLSACISTSETSPGGISQIPQAENPTKTEVPTPEPLPKSTPTQITQTVCLDRIHTSDIDDLGEPAQATFPVRFTIEEIRTYLNQEPDRFLIYEKVLHGRPIMIAMEVDSIPDGGISKEAYTSQYADYFFDNYLFYWDIFRGNPYPYFVMIVLQENDPSINNKFYNTIPYINFHEGLNDPSILTHEMSEIWMGEGGSCMSGPEWFVTSSNVFLEYRYSQQADIISTMAYFDEMMQSSRFYGKSLADVVGGPGATDNDHVYGEWDGFKVKYMIDEQLFKFGKSMDDVYHLLYLQSGANPWQEAFTNQDIQDVLFEISGDDFSDIFDAHVYDYTPFPEYDYPFLCHDGYGEVEMLNPIPDSPQNQVVSQMNEVFFNELNWDDYTFQINDRLNDSTHGPDMDFDRINVKLQDEGMYIRIQGNEPFTTEESEIDFTFTNSDGKTFGFGTHPDCMVSVWDCDKCNGAVTQAESLVVLWADDIFIFIPADSVEGNMEIKTFWFAMNYPESGGNWTTADDAEK